MGQRAQELSPVTFTATDLVVPDARESKRQRTAETLLTGLSQLEGVAAREAALDGHRDQKVCTTKAIFSLWSRSLPQELLRGGRWAWLVRLSWCSLPSLIRGWNCKNITCTNSTVKFRVVKRLGLA